MNIFSTLHGAKFIWAPKVNPRGAEEAIYFSYFAVKKLKESNSPENIPSSGKIRLKYFTDELP